MPCSRLLELLPITFRINICIVSLAGLLELLVWVWVFSCMTALVKVLVLVDPLLFVLSVLCSLVMLGLMVTVGVILGINGWNVYGLL